MDAVQWLCSHPLLENGAHLSAPEFLEAYEATDSKFKAELIDGIVHVASPVSLQHGECHADMLGWLGAYRAANPTVRIADNATILFGQKDIPQPDIHVRYVRTPVTSTTKYLHVAPELVVEIALTSASIDLHEKRELYRRHGVREYIVWRVFDQAIDWFVLAGGDYRPLEPDAAGVIHSQVFPGLRLALKAMVDRDLAAVLAVQQS